MAFSQLKAVDIMIRTVSLPVALAALLSACAGEDQSDKAALIASCISSGETEKTCKCVVEEVDKTLDDESLHFVLLASKYNDAPPAEADRIRAQLEALPPDKQEKLAQSGLAMSAASSSCSGTGPAPH